MQEDLFDSLLNSTEHSIPVSCSKCGGSLEYKGLGEYVCSLCGFIERDDYSKVREFLELHRGASIIDISNATGVSRGVITKMLKESRFSLMNSDSGFLRCEIYGRNIDSGRYCKYCNIDTQNNSISDDSNNVKKRRVYVGPSDGENKGKFRYNK